MSARQWIRKLLSLNEPEAQEAWGVSERAAELTRQAERIAWVRETSGALREAQREADQAWERLLAEEAPPPSEGAPGSEPSPGRSDPTAGGTRASAWEGEGAVPLAWPRGSSRAGLSFGR